MLTKRGNVNAVIFFTTDNQVFDATDVILKMWSKINIYVYLFPTAFPKTKTRYDDK